MKHIKKFNESLENHLEQLKDFCESNLVYLLDEGFQLKYDTQVIHFPEIRTVRHDGDAGVNIKIMCPNYRKNNFFDNNGALVSVVNTYWSDIKDYIIPFLQRLCNEYQLYTYYEEKKFDYEKTINLIKLKEDKYVALQEETKFKYYTLEDLIEDKLPQDKWFYSLSVKVKIEK